MNDAISRRPALILLVLATACGGASELPGDPGYVTGTCIEHQCIGEALVCLSDLCVDPTAAGGSESAADVEDGGAEASDGSDAQSSGDDDSGGASDGTTSPGDDGNDVDSGPNPTDDDGNDTAADGTMCDVDEECRSGHCFVLGVLGGVCGECKVDADCDGGGCSLPDPYASPPAGSTCNRGGPGDGCMSDAACAGDLLCAVILDIPGVFTTSTCSECQSDADCDGSLCAPQIEPASVGGTLRCVAPGSLANGDTCDFAGSGDASCDSGHCAVANVMNVFELGVCSECEDAGDCGGAPCIPAEVQDSAIVPASCG